IGGQTYSGESCLSTVEIFDTTTNQWRSGAPMPTARCYIALASVGNTIYAIGGVTAFIPGGWVFSTVVEAYDILTNQWTTSTPLPNSFTGIAMSATTVNNVIYFVVYDLIGSGSTLTYSFYPTVNPCFLN
ncbi:MAG: kelch repeat-containing protein, partial [archaeon]|nr:kelch repeat-containing protein [archaeon]